MRSKFDDKRFKELGSMSNWNKNEGWTYSSCHLWQKTATDYNFGGEKLNINLDKSRYLSSSWFCETRSYPKPISKEELKVEIVTVINKNFKLSRAKIGNKTWDGLLDKFGNFLTENGKEYTINYETLAKEIANLKDSSTTEEETIKLDIRKKPNVRNWTDDVKLKIFDKIFKQLKDIVTSKLQNKNLGNDSHFLNDIVDNLVDNQYVFSLIEENKKFKKRLNEKIASTKEDNLSVDTLEISGVENQNNTIFETTKENWQQFNFFNKATMETKIALRQKWFIYNGEDPKNTNIKDINNVEQSVLFDSEEDAKEWIARDGKTFLRKRYECYLLDNPFPITVWMENEDEVIDYIRNSMVKLDYTYIHKSLAKDLSQKYDFKITFPLWSEIDTSGLYTVYGYKSLSTGEYLYYKSYDEAYNSYIKHVPLTTDVVESKENVYYYQYTKIVDNGKKISRKCKHNNTIETIEKCANEVYKVIKENEKIIVNNK